MGVDYAGVGGIGIQITDADEENIREFIATFASDHELDIDTDENFGEMLDSFFYRKDYDINYAEAGSYGYTSDRTWYLLVPGDTLDELYNNADTFLANLKKIGLDKTRADLKVIEDLLIY